MESRFCCFLCLGWLLVFAARAQEGVHTPTATSASRSSFSHEGASHVVREGDSLWKLAELYWGDAEQWPALWALNEHIKNPHLIYPGEVIYLGFSMGKDESPVLEPPDNL